CESLEELNLSNFNTTKVKDMSKMFYGCKNLRILDLSNFDVSEVEDSDDMFAGCENLEELKINKRALMKLLDKDENIFEDCGNLKIIDATTGNEISLNSFYL
ncbi:MAG: BspA family leucine-rich repeat surface protein, partial [Alphaproteobacteria bacterium]|nr:BspA family leucine-rich repeat surface protein [Alphaproteobacteria bacterium]